MQQKDESLVMDLRLGNNDSFGELFGRSYDYFKTKCSVCGFKNHPFIDEGELYDIFLKSFFAATKNYEVGLASFRTYFEKIVVNNYICAYKKIQNSTDPIFSATSLDTLVGENKDIPLLEVLSLSDGQKDIGTEISENEQFDLYFTAVDSLKNKRQKEAFALYVKGYSAKEISEMLCINERTARKYIAKTKKFLTGKFEENE